MCIVRNPITKVKMDQNAELVSMDDDVKMSTEVSTSHSSPKETVNLKEVISTLDSWNRTCTSVLDMLNDQITKVTMGCVSKP